MSQAHISETTPKAERTFNVFGNSGFLIGTIQKNQYTGKYGFRPSSTANDERGISMGTMRMILMSLEDLNR